MASVLTQVRAGPLVERDFRLLFSATTVTALGDAIAAIALAFAVLEIGTGADLGIVLAVRQGVQVPLLLVGGVIADRLPRHLVLVGAALVQGVAQAATAGLVLTGEATVGRIVALQALYGIGAAVLWPAEVGLVPQVVSESRLQAANALQGLSRNVVEVLGPALGGLLVVAGSPGGALAVDAASFLLCALILALIRAGRTASRAQSMIADLREGWREFASRRWLWISVTLFAVSGLAYAPVMVLGPVVAKESLGGAGAWGTILTCAGIGAVLGGLVALRVRPRRPLAASVLCALPLPAEAAALALRWPTWAISAVALVAGIGLAIHVALWFTVFQREVPEEVLARVSSYDALGSFALMPIGFAVAGPLGDAIGVATTLWLAAVTDALSLVAVLCVPSVWRIRHG